MAKRGRYRMEKTRVFIADDHQVVRRGIKNTLGDYPEFEIVGEARQGRDAVKKVRALKPDVVVMDISMPDLNGIDATRQIKQFDGGIHVVIFTMYSDTEYLVDLLQCGISGYVLKEDPMSELVQAIREVSKGRKYFTKSMPHVLFRYFESQRQDKGRNQEGEIFNRLSLREREVLQLLAEGNQVKEIAGKLGVSPKTVESHKYNCMSKLGVSSVAELTRIAIKMKLIQV